MTLVFRRPRTDVAPWNALCGIEDHFNRFLSNPFGSAADWQSTVDGWAPAIDVTENENAYVVEADIPGVNKENVTLEILENVLTIKGERKNVKTSEDKISGFHRTERAYGSFQRAIRIPGRFNSGAVNATFENGVLKVTLPKPEETKPRVITVQSN